MKLSFLSINSGGAPGAWKILNENFLGAAVVAIQDLGMTCSEWEGFARLSKKKGYHAYRQKGATEPRPRGGVAFLIHRSVRHRFAMSHSNFNTQMIGVWINGTLFMNMYAPPGDNAVAAEVFSSFAAAVPLGPEWVILGDFNEEPNESLGDLFGKFGAKYLGPPSEQATRWEGRRCIDWIMGSSSRISSVKLQSDVVLSDHQGILFHFQPGGLQDQRKGRLKPAPYWPRPPDIDSDTWQEALTKAWNEHVTGLEEFQRLCEYCDNDIPLLQNEIQTQWNCFMSCLSSCFMKAIRNLHDLNQNSPHLDRFLRRAGAKTKGQIAQFQWITEQAAQSNHPTEGERTRKLRRHLARCYELLRCCNNHKEPDPRLLQRVLKNESTDIPGGPVLAQKVSRLIESSKHQLEALQNADKTAKLAAWKAKVNDPTLKGLGRWIRARENSIQAFTLQHQGRQMEHRTEVARQFGDFWKQVWSDNEVDHTQAANALAQDFVSSGLDPLEHEWQDLSLKDLWTSIRNAGGAAGPDHWSSEEVKHIPVPAIEYFLKITRDWNSSGCIPQQLKEVKQVAIPKNHKIRNGFLDLKDVRPISICSIWWRVYASAFVKAKGTRDWCAKFIHPAVSIGKGAKGAEEMASDLQEALMSGGFAASLDWTQAYDRMKPEITTKVLTHLGFPPGFVAILTAAWTEQVRWICYDGHTHPSPLRSRATPQGCPVAPMVLAIWSSAGLRFVENSQQSNVTVQHFVYMDDRSMKCNQLEGISHAIEAWQCWSDKMGLRESPEKTQVCGKTKKQQSQVVERHPSWAQSDIKVLGATTVCRTRTYSQSEQDRLSQAMARARLLQVCPLSWKLRIRAFAALVISKASYGWVGKWPTKQTSEKLFSALLHGFHAGFSAARNLRKLFFGALTDLQITLLTRTWGRCRRQVERNGLPQWGNRPHTTIALLRSQLKKLGFVEARPFVWHPPRCWALAFPSERLQLNLGNLQQDVNLQLHNIRTLYRCQQFEGFIKSDRRDARELRQFLSPAALRHRFGNTDLKKCRGWIENSAEFRSVVFGSFWSPAALEPRMSGDPTCPWCLRCLGTHSHIFWQCPQNADLRNMYPHHFQDLDPLTLRLGWLQHDTNEIVVSHMCNTVKHIWKLRHPD